MITEVLTVIISGLSLIVIVLGFVINGLKQDLQNLWEAHTTFRDKVHDNYATKEYVKDHGNANHQLLLENINAIVDKVDHLQKDIESMEDQIRGINEIGPQLLVTLTAIQRQTSRGD